MRAASTVAALLALLVASPLRPLLAASENLFDRFTPRIAETTANNVQYVLTACYTGATEMAIVVPSNIRPDDITPAYLAALVTRAVGLAPALARGKASATGYRCDPAPYPNAVAIHQDNYSININHGYSYRTQDGQIRLPSSPVNESFYIAGNLIAKWQGTIDLQGLRPPYAPVWRGPLVDYIQAAEEEKTARPRNEPREKTTAPPRP